MKGKELIELIDNLTLAALRYELAKQNMDKAEETLDRLSERFNNEINNIRAELSTNIELVNKIELVSKIFDDLKLGKILQ
jgi:hypothetical protein